MIPEKEYSFRSPRQHRIYERMSRLIGLGPAAFFRTACWIMDMEDPPASGTHLVGHLMREIEDALRDITVPYLSPESKESSHDDTNHAKSIQSILEATEHSPGDPVWAAWHSLIGKGKGTSRGLYAWAHRNSLDPPRPLDSEFRQAWDEMALVLDEILDDLERRFSNLYPQLDRLKEKDPPAKKDVQFLRNSFPNNYATMHYFFEGLDDPRWIPMLRAARFFDHPRPPMRHPEGGVSYPPWPQSRFLASIAERAPKAVREILQGIETDNISVRIDIVDAAIRLPPEEATHLTGQVCGWCQEPFMAFPVRARELIGKLARAGYCEDAGRLALSLFDVIPGRLPAGIEDEEIMSRHVPEPRLRAESWELEQFIREEMPSGVKSCAKEFLISFMSLLKTALEHRRKSTDKGYEDFSSVWRPAIEPHDQNWEHGDAKDLLTTAVRESAEALASNTRGALMETLALLRSERGTIFRRLALHIIRVNGAADPELARSTVLDREVLNDSSLHHEYIMLCQDYFHTLTEIQKEKLLGWIREDREKSAEEGGLSDRRVLAILTVVREDIPYEYQTWREELANRFTADDHPTFTVWQEGVQVGPTSPLAPDAIQEMEVDELIEYLEGWQQDDPTSMQLPEGVSRALTAAVSEIPSLFTGEIARLRELDRTYIRGILAGYREALADDKNIPWAELLDLMEWIAGQEDAAGKSRPTSLGGLDPSWIWAKSEVASLLQNGLSSGEQGIPKQLSDLIVRILLGLVEDGQAGASEQEVGEGMDPATQSINTLLGKSLHALITFAVWRKKHLAERNHLEADDVSWADLPEVRKKLEELLGLEKPLPQIIYAVFGWRFPNLSYIDKGWARSFRTIVFPKRPELRDGLYAAWGSLVGRNYPSASLYALLRSEYELAVSLFDDEWPEIPFGRDPAKKTIEHVLVLYVGGLVELDTTIVQGIWHCDRIELRQHALHFAGNRLSALGESQRERLVQLWESRMTQIESKREKAEELDRFGWWFSSGEFDDEWALGKLLRVLGLGVTPQPPYRVSERLGVLASTHPNQVLEAYRRLIDLEGQEPWHILSMRKGLKEALSRIVESGDSDSKRGARELASRLAARGHREFTDSVL